MKMGPFLLLLGRVLVLFAQLANNNIFKRNFIDPLRICMSFHSFFPEFLYVEILFLILK